MTDLKLSRILVAVDLGESCIPALHYTRSLAQRFDAAVTVVYADDSLTLQSYDELVAGWAVEPDEANALAAAVRRFATPHLAGVSFEVVVSEDDAAHAIVTHGKAARADLIVMGTHARRGVARILGGSVAEEVMKHADRPVVAVPSPGGPATLESPKITRIVCPVDDSRAAHDAARMASALARMFGAELYLVNTSAQGSLRQFDDDLRAAGGTRPRCTMARLDPSHRRSAARLLDCVDEVGGDLLVVGATQKKNRTQSVIGVTTERLIRGGRTPLMTVVR